MSEPTGTRPFAPFEWMLSLRYLRARRKEGFISVIAGFSFLGIMLGVATLIIVMAVMNGFRKELLDKILGLNGHLLVQPLESPLTDWDAVAERICRRAGRPARGADRRGPGAGLVAVQRLAACWCAASAPPTSTSSPRSPTISEQGTLEGFDEGQGVAIGTRLADQLVAARRRQCHAGRAARRGHADGHDAAHQGLQGRRACSRSACRNTTPPSSSCRCRKRRLYFNRAGDVTAIEVYIDNPDRVRRLPQARRPRPRERPIFMVDWRQRNATFFNALQVERNVMFLILTLIVLVAALNIISGLIMLVKDKGRDIAILRTMGATQGAIMRVFLITGASIGVVGTCRASWSASLVCLNIESIRQFLSWLTATELFSPELYFLSRLPAEMDAGETTAVVVMALDAVAARDALSVLARGAARSGRGAAV